MHNLVQYICNSLHRVWISHFLFHLQQSCSQTLPRLDPIISIMDEPMDPAMLLFGETPAAWQGQVTKSPSDRCTTLGISWLFHTIQHYSILFPQTRETIESHMNRSHVQEVKKHGVVRLHMHVSSACRQIHQLMQTLFACHRATSLLRVPGRNGLRRKWERSKSYAAWHWTVSP